MCVWIGPDTTSPRGQDYSFTPRLRLGRTPRLAFGSIFRASVTCSCSSCRHQGNRCPTPRCHHCQMLALRLLAQADTHSLPHGGLPTLPSPTRPRRAERERRIAPVKGAEQSIDRRAELFVTWGEGSAGLHYRRTGRLRLVTNSGWPIAADTAGTVTLAFGVRHVLVLFCLSKRLGRGGPSKCRHSRQRLHDPVRRKHHNGGLCAVHGRARSNPFGTAQPWRWGPHRHNKRTQWTF